MSKDMKGVDESEKDLRNIRGYAESQPDMVLGSQSGGWL
jgi:hypothetical protein